MKYEFDLESWFQLAKTDIKKFENKREQLINQLLEIANDKRRLTGLQFQINMRRRKSKNAMDACISLSHLMTEQFYTQFYPAYGRSSTDIYNDKSKTKTGQVIPFPKNNKS